MRSIVLVLLAAGCVPSVVAYPERSEPGLGSRKRTLKAAEEALRAAMAASDVALVKAPGNDEPVVIEASCVNGAWFTLPGKAEQWLGETHQYAWHVCVGDEGKYQVSVACLEVKRSETSTEAHECGGGQVAGEIAKRTDKIVDGMKAR